MKISSFDANTRTVTFAPFIIWVVDNALCHAVPDIDQTASVHRRHSLLSGRLAAALLPKFRSDLNSAGYQKMDEIDTDSIPQG